MRLGSPGWCALAAVSMLAGPADAAGTLYGTGPSGFLIRIDVSTGVGTYVGTLPSLCSSTGNAVTEIEFSNVTRRAFAQCGNGDFSGFEFDPDTGGGLTPEIPNGSSFNGLETIGPVWYGASITAPNGNSTLYTLDPFAGTSTPIGPTGVGPLSGIAHDKRSGVVYAISGGGGTSSLYTVNLATGAATLVGSAGITAGSLEFGPDGRLYAGGGGLNAGNLYVVDRMTGAATLVGATGLGTLSGLMLLDLDCNDTANPFLNCGFESGDFTSWVTQDHPQPFFPLTVDEAGVTPDPLLGLFTSDPTEGAFAALHGFDGNGGSPAHIRIGQDVTIPGGGELEFDYRVGWDLVNFCTPPCADRTFDVVVEPAGGGAPLATTRILTAAGETIQLDSGDKVGRVDLTAFGGQSVRVVFDWFVPEELTGPAFFQLDDVKVSAPVGYFTVTPCRVIDTRNPDGPLAGPALAAGGDRAFTVAGACGIPPTAKAVSVNIAVTGPGAPGNLRLRAGGTAVPLVASITYAPGQTRSSNAIVPLSATGQIAVFTAQGAGTVHLILDVNGYFK